MQTSKKQQTSSFTQVRSKIKVVFLGDQSTGKTSILSRFIHDTFEENVEATIGVDFMAKNVSLNNRILRMQLWDTAGQQRFRSLIPSYLKDAMIVIIVFDLTNLMSLEHLNEWIDLYQNNKRERTVVLVVGNKSDLEEERVVPREDAERRVQEFGLQYVQVSAKTGKNVKEAFEKAGQAYIAANTDNSEMSISTVFHDRSMVPDMVTNSTNVLSINTNPVLRHQQLTAGKDKKPIKRCC